MKRTLQTLTTTPEQEQGALDPTAQPFQVGDPLPLVLGVADMCRVFGIGRSGFHRRERRGEFARFELPRVRTTEPKRWSGTRIARYLSGESFTVAARRRA